MLRLLCATSAVVLLSTSCATDPTTAPAASVAPVPAEQILWQRTLEDALAISKVRHQPLLLAINMDGESASDRIYSERYRDPAFVAATRHCVCVGASVFRHNPRDHDDQGRRIPCPRFGEITCGEHMALEPVLWAKYLSDGERVAPRHALVRADGTKAWDLSLCFDLKDVDRALFASLGDAPVTADEPPLPQEHRQRVVAEDALVVGRDGAGPSGLWLAGLELHPDPAAIEGLRRLVPELRARVPLSIDIGVLPELFAPAVIACRLTAPIGRDVWDALQRAEGDRADALLQTLELLAAAEPAVGFQVHACRALASPQAPSLATLLAEGDAVTQRLGGRAPMARNKGDEMADAATLEHELDEAEKRLAKNGDDAALHATFAKASLDLGRQHLDAGKKDARFLLEDAAAHWRKAVTADAGRYDWWIESARAAYFLSDFVGEAECGRRALALATGRPVGELPADATTVDARTAEALRWIGDAAARRLAELQPAGADTGTVVREALLALGLVAASEHADANDQGSFVSACGALACRRAEVAAAEAAAMRFPASNDLRAALTRALWASGRIGEAPAVAGRIAARAPGAVSAWFVGQAFVFAAEDCRRRDETESAVVAYDAAKARFADAAAQNPEFANDCALRIAECWFGRGMALVNTADRAAAAECLERAIASHVDVKGHRDGLGYDCLDLVDRLVEWRDAGGESPVAPLALFERLAKVSGDAYWPTAIADACIREGLRADGRNPERVEKETVDAGGAPMRAMVGLPTPRGD
ncbi:MAG: hypothetical protein JNK78_19700, partial [Planctomycetes bacterium]|nr:hypothetical protein [Planctomycetota bacterium]